jgi:N4-gp56 family major capsid protein
MAVTTVATAGTYDQGNVVLQWSRRIFREYIRAERFARYTGKKPNNVFQVIEELGAKPGVTITMPLITRLTGNGVTGDNTLEGQEEALGNYADSITVDQLRHAVRRGNYEQKKTLIGILEEGEYMLKKWCMEQLRDLKIARMLCVHLDGVTAYESTAEADKDAHLAANTDRYLFGTLLGNRSTTDHSASLLNVDTTDDTLDRGIISLCRRIAMTADPHIMPITVEEDREMYVAFVGSNPYRDLRADMDTVHQNAGPRGETNKLWRTGDLVYEDVVIREIPEMTSIGNVGNSSAPVYHFAFCGAQAVGLAWAQHTKQIFLNGRVGVDYGNQRGVGVAEVRGAKKTHFNSIQHGMVQGYVAAAADG